MASHSSRSSRLQIRCGRRWRRIRLTCGIVRPGRFSPHLLLELQEEQTGQQGEGDMMVPASPATDFVLVEPDLAFRLLEAGLDRPAARRNPAEQEQRHSWWSVGQVQLEFAAIGIAAEDGGQLATQDS